MAESKRTTEAMLRSYAWKYYKYQLSEGGTAQTEDLEKAQIELLAHVAAIEAERDKLRKDSERLQATILAELQRMTATPNYLLPSQGAGFHHCGGYVAGLRFARKAIGAAMTPEPKDVSA